MILDNLGTTLCDYGGMGPKLARAFDWLRETDLAKLTPGTTVSIDGKRVYALVQEYSTNPASERVFEAHRLYIDIQVVVSGRERIQWAALDAMGEVTGAYVYEKDVVKFAEPANCVNLDMGPGDFAVLFPSDGHKPGCSIDKSEKVQKIVVKIAV